MLKAYVIREIEILRTTDEGDHIRYWMLAAKIWPDYMPIPTEKTGIIADRAQDPEELTQVVFDPSRFLVLLHMDKYKIREDEMIEDYPTPSEYIEKHPDWAYFGMFEGMREGDTVSHTLENSPLYCSAEKLVEFQTMLSKHAVAINQWP